jgi:hypothetical protein
MENQFIKLDFDNPLLDSIIAFSLTILFQYIEHVYDEKKSISIRLSLFISLIVFLMVYYTSNKYIKTNITTQDIFTDMGAF